MTAPALQPKDVAHAFGVDDAHYLGRGGFGETWLLDDYPLDEVPTRVAAKILQKDQVNPTLIKREVGGLSELHGCGIVGFHELIDDINIDGTAYIALLCEYVPGGSALDNLRGGSPGHDEVTAMGAALLGTVAELHGIDRLHRDIKLENIILRDRAWADPVLIDFGLSKGLLDSTHTIYPNHVGTLPYMAPEVLAGDPPRKQADLWACGVVLYFTLTRTHPFIDLSQLASLDVGDLVDIVTGPPKALPDDVPVGLADVIVRLLEIEPHRRGSARRAAAELRSLL